MVLVFIWQSLWLVYFLKNELRGSGQSCAKNVTIYAIWRREKYFRSDTAGNYNIFPAARCLERRNCARCQWRLEKIVNTLLGYSRTLRKGLQFIIVTSDTKCNVECALCYEMEVGLQISMDHGRKIVFRQAVCLSDLQDAFYVSHCAWFYKARNAETDEVNVKSTKAVSLFAWDHGKHAHFRNWIVHL